MNAGCARALCVASMVLASLKLALCAEGGQGDLEALLKRLKQAGPEQRRGAINSLAEIGPEAKRGVRAIAEMLKDPDAEVRCAAALALHHIMPPGFDVFKVLPHLRYSADMPPAEYLSPEDRAKLARATEKANEETAEAAKFAVPALAQALQDSSMYVREYAALALGSCGTHAKGAVPSLVRALRDTVCAVRSRALRTLGQIGPGAQAAVPALIAYVKEEHATEVEPDLMRATAVQALGDIGPAAKDAVPLLLGLLPDKGKPGRRYAVARALGCIGPSDKEVIAALIGALGDRDRMVRGEAARVLGKAQVEKRAVIEALERAAKDEDSYIRGCAEEALWTIRRVSAESEGKDPAKRKSNH